jgi:hypothetical protein
MSSDPVSRTSAENARLPAGLEAERRADAGSARPRDGATLASDADRDCATEALKSAYAEGRLDRNQFEARLTAALTATSHMAVTTATADLPESLVPADPAPAPTPRQRHRVPGRMLLWLAAQAAWIAACILLKPTTAVFAVMLAAEFALVAGLIRSWWLMASGR